MTFCVNCKHLVTAQVVSVSLGIPRLRAEDKLLVRQKSTNLDQCLGAPPKNRAIDFVYGVEEIEYQEPKDVNKGNCIYFEQRPIDQPTFPSLTKEKPNEAVSV